MKLKVLVGSTNKNKIKATEEAFAIAFPTEEFLVQGIAAASQINEQPIGYQETLQGALNRLENVKQTDDNYDFVAALENGLVYFSDDNSQTWLDFAWVVVEDKKGKQSRTISAHAVMPTSYVERAKIKGFEKTTAAGLMEKDHGFTTSVHEYLTGGLSSRKEILKQALLIAIGQQKDTKNKG